MNRIGRLVEYHDPHGYFVFPICLPCCIRLERLPPRLQEKQHHLAVARLARHPEQHEYRGFATCAEARIFRVLEAERLSRELIDA